MSKQAKIIFITIVGVFLIWGVYRVYQNQTRSVSASSEEKLRLGWQTQWATQGQIIQALKHTQILKDNEVEIEFVPGTFGPQLNEYALSNPRQVDVILTADQPACVLLSKQPDKWVIVGRLMYNRVGIYVPFKSSVQKLGDLKNKTIGVPFGAAAERDALMALASQGLTPKVDVFVQNVAMEEQSAILNSEKPSNGFDAYAGFDPSLAQFSIDKKARILHEGKIVSVVVMSKEYLKKNPKSVMRFLKSFIQGWYFYSQNQSQANKWFISDSKLSFTESALDSAAVIEPNIDAATISDIKVDFSEDDYKIMQQAADFLFKNKKITSQVTMKDHVDTSIINDVKNELVSQ